LANSKTKRRRKKLKVQVKTQELIDTVAQAKAGIVGRPSLEILSYVHLAAQKGMVAVTGSNIETFVQAFCKAKVVNKGVVCLPAAELLDSLKALAGQSPTVTLVVTRSRTRVALSYDEIEKLKAGGTPPEQIPSSKPGWKHGFRIEAGKAWSTLPFKDAKDYPHIPVIKPNAVIQFHNLVSAIGEVDYAMAHEENRPALHGLSMKQVNGHVALAAADGFRLAINMVKTRGKVPQDIIIPASSVAAIKKLMPEDARLDIMAYKKNNAMPSEERQKLHCLAFRNRKGTVSVLCYALDSTFPKYEQLIPKTSKKITVAKAALEQALRFMATMNGKEAVRLQKKSGDLVISRKGYEREVATRIPATGSIKIGTDLTYLTDLAKRLDDEITLRWKDSKSPLLARQGTTTHVLMPMMVQW
jgi:DNA polymerase III beta subunit